MKNIIAKLIIFFLLLIIGVSVSAQVGIPNEESVQFFVTPSVAQPNFPSKATVESFIINLDVLNISWFLNGELVKSGFGEKTFDFTTGPVGSSSVISVIISSPVGDIQFEKSVSPQGVSLVWEAVSYTPPFYKGRALNPPGGNITVVAIPNTVSSSGNRLDPDTLVYTWKKDGTVLGEKSGVGKRSVSIEGSVLEDVPTVGVLVESGDGKIKAQNAIRVPVHTPEIHFYEQDPLLGTLFNRSLSGTINMENDELTIDMHPYYFSGSRDVSTFRWKVNGRPTQNANPFITLGKSAGSGSAFVSVQGQHEKKVLQSAEKFLKINFTE